MTEWHHVQFPANPDTLYRVFGNGDWGNKEIFTDKLLKDLIEGFSAISPLETRPSAPMFSMMLMITVLASLPM
jgi:hypothetical protein